jgi:hypothetical protein
MNQIVPGHSRVVKELVLVEDSHIPFEVTDKRTVKVKATLGLYAEQIEKAYQDLEMKQSDEISFPTTFDNGSIFSFLQDALHFLLPDTILTSEADLFEHGEH